MEMIEMAKSIAELKATVEVIGWLVVFACTLTIFK